MSTASNPRRDRLQEILRSRGFAALGELASELAVSESTVRRDFELLERSGLARRTHGGAFWTGNADSMPIFDDRDPGLGDRNWREKDAIARRAAMMIADGETILLDGGSTTYAIARQLVSRRMQVVTNSLPVAQVLAAGPDIDLIMIGGCVRGATAVSIGPMATHQIEQLNVTTSIISIAGVSDRGFFNSDMMLVESERAMIAAAERVMVVSDQSKIGRVSLCRICPLSDVDVMVTGGPLDSHWESTFRDAGIELAFASEEDTGASSDGDRIN